MCYINQNSGGTGSLEDNQNIIIKESIYVISDDRKHDSAAVRKFTEKVVEKYGIKNEIQFSDGYAAHYRSKSAVADLSKIKNLNVSRHYFESSEADGLAAVLKNAVSRAVTQRKVEIFNVNDFFTYCENNLSNVGDDMMEIWPSKQKASKNSVRKFIFVSETEIPRNNNSDSQAMLKGSIPSQVIATLCSISDTHHILLPNIHMYELVIE